MLPLNTETKLRSIKSNILIYKKKRAQIKYLNIVKITKYYYTFFKDFSYLRKKDQIKDLSNI